MDSDRLVLRSYLKSGEDKRIREITESFEDFYPQEVDVAEELANASIEIGPDKSGYHFLLYENNNEIIGYACFGPIACTKNSFDLYWIVIDNKYRTMGIGKKLLLETEEKIFNLGGKKIYVETSSRNSYYPTRQFYIKNGYKEEAILKDFYDDDDNKVIYVKSLE